MFYLKSIFHHKFCLFCVGNQAQSKRIIQLSQIILPIFHIMDFPSESGTFGVLFDEYVNFKTMDIVIGEKKIF